MSKPEFTWEMREIKGEKVPVKVYPASGKQSAQSNYTRFHYSRPATKSDLSRATERSMKKFSSRSKKNKR